jgi:hypothetical protein
VKNLPETVSRLVERAGLSAEEPDQLLLARANYH